MRKRGYLMLLLSLPTLSLAEIHPEHPAITVFTTQFYPIKQAQLAQQVYYLDAVDTLEESTSKLFKQPAQAEIVAKQWLHSNEGKQFQQVLQQAYEGVIAGWKLGVMKVPAIVFNPNSPTPTVIYGETNVQKALNTYRHTFDMKE